MSSQFPRALGILLAAVLVGACVRPAPTTEINRDRAVEIARPQASFQPDTTDAVRTISDKRPVWRVTLRGRLPGQPPMLFETVIVEIDRRTGEIVSIAKS